MLVGWSLPACPGALPVCRKRAAWKSRIATCDISRFDCTHWPSPDFSRSRSAVMIPSAANRPVAGDSRDRHETAHPLRDLVEPRPVAVRPVLAEARDAREDDARVDLLQRLVVDAEAALHVGAVVLDHH